MRHLETDPSKGNLRKCGSWWIVNLLNAAASLMIRKKKKHKFQFQTNFCIIVYIIDICRDVSYIIATFIDIHIHWTEFWGVNHTKTSPRVISLMSQLLGIDFTSPKQPDLLEIWSPKILAVQKRDIETNPVDLCKNGSIFGKLFTGGYAPWSFLR